MIKKYEPPYFIILFLVCLVNSLFSIYFITVLLIGIVFKVFESSLQNDHNYLLLMTVLSFLFIENIQGFYPFSLTIISLIIYFLVIPRVKHFFSSGSIATFLSLFLFYLCLFICILISVPYEFHIIIKLVYNLLIDIVIIGFIL